MSVNLISKPALQEKAKDYLSGNKGIEPSFLLTMAFRTSTLDKKTAADVMGVQLTQVSKYGHPSNPMTHKAAKALAQAVVDAP